MVCSCYLRLLVTKHLLNIDIHGRDCLLSISSHKRVDALP